MEPRFERRKAQLLAGCQVPPTLFRGAMRRLEDFAQPFAAALPSPESRHHSRTYIAGLLSDVERKNAESIAYRYDLDRQVIQRFIGEVGWDHEPLIDVLNRQVATAIGQADAVVDFRLYLPREWANDKKRRERAGVPKGVPYRTRHELALEMLERHGPMLPHSWVAGDDEMGRPAWFRQRLAREGRRYFLAV